MTPRTRRELPTSAQAARGNEAVKGFLVDLDGTLYLKGKPYAQATEAIASLRNAGFALQFLTNTTAQTPDMIRRRLEEMGFGVREEEVLNATHACLRFLRSLPEARCHLLVDDAVEAYFAEFRSDENPTHVVVGDHGPRFTFDSLNRAFQLLLDGAGLIALQMGRFWFGPDGPRLDCGSFATLLEYASGKTATVIGKPSETFFRIALERIRLAPEEAVMVGDDVTTDLRGAALLGMRSVLVRTGKFTPEALEQSEDRPTWVIDSIADLPELAARIPAFDA